jgi:hypothetical protein
MFPDVVFVFTCHRGEKTKYYVRLLNKQEFCGQHQCKATLRGPGGTSDMYNSARPLPVTSEVPLSCSPLLPALLAALCAHPLTSQRALFENILWINMALSLAKRVRTIVYLTIIETIYVLLFLSAVR